VFSSWFVNISAASRQVAEKWVRVMTMLTKFEIRGMGPERKTFHHLFSNDKKDEAVNARFWKFSYLSYSFIIV
jgi:hypothetical protein